MRVDVVGNATPETVWERFARPAQWAGWAPHIRRVECEAERITVGTRGVVHGPWPTRVSFVVDEVDAAGRRWTWSVGRAVSITMAHGVEPDGAGSRVWVRLPAVVGVPYLPLLRWALRRLARATPQSSAS